MGYHVAHLVLSLPIGGTERLVEQMLRNPPAGATTSGICLDRLGALGEGLRKDGIPLACLDRKPGLQLGLPFRLASITRATGIKVLHCHHYTPWFYGILARLFHPSLKVVFTEHGRFYPDVSSAKRRIFNRIFGPLTPAITAVSPSVKDALVKVEAFDPDRIRVVFNGVREPQALPSRAVCRASLGLEAGKVSFILCARFDPIKWIPGLVKAFKLVADADPAAELILVGDGPDMGAVTAAIRDLGLEGRVKLPGFRSDVPLWLRASDIFVLSSLSEGTSVSLIESMSLGLPCVATKVGGNEFVMEADSTGLLVPSTDAEALGGAMLRLLRDPDLRREFGANARARYDSRFRLETMFTAYAGLYRDLVKNGGNAP